MQTLISEPTARFETKFRDAHFSLSFHNFIGASNYAPEQIMQLNSKMRRYIFRTKMLPYTTQQWGKLHAIVTDDSIRELFWMLLRTRNVAHIRQGTAPENDFMASAVAQSAPEAIGYLKHLCLAATDDLQPRDGQGLYGNSSNALPSAIASHPDALVLKERAADTPASMSNLLGPELEDALLQYDLSANHARRNGIARMTSYIRVPTGHLYGCIARSVQGQRFTTVNEQAFSFQCKKSIAKRARFEEPESSSSDDEDEDEQLRRADANRASLTRAAYEQQLQQYKSDIIYKQLFPYL